MPKDPRGAQRGTEEPGHSPDPDPVELPVEDHIDLHLFRPRDIPDVVVSYLDAARQHGFEEVRVVHGKGTGFQRQRVQQVLETLPYVISYSDAPASRGHWGATLVRLRRPDSDEHAP